MLTTIGTVVVTHVQDWTKCTVSYYTQTRLLRTRDMRNILLRDKYWQIDLIEEGGVWLTDVICEARDDNPKYCQIDFFG